MTRSTAFEPEFVDETRFSSRSCSPRLRLGVEAPLPLTAG